MNDVKLDYPDFDAMTYLHQKLGDKTAKFPTGFDPHQMMVDKNNGQSDISIKSFSEKDVKKLEDFCKKMNIVGFNCGRMHPLAALAMLKEKLGYCDPEESKNTNREGYGPNYPYTERMQKRQLLKG